MRKVLLIKGICLAFLALGCSSDDDGPTIGPVDQTPETPDSVEVEVLTGVFKDAEVQGLRFETATQSGATNENGEFTYAAGEEVTFKLGDVVLGTVPGQELVTPVTLSSNGDGEALVSDPVAINIAALLQTLDSDGDADNGIQIPQAVAADLGVSEIDFSVPIERTLADVVLYSSQNHGTYLKVVYPSNAAQHLATSLNEEFTGEPNLSVSHYVPFMKSVFSASVFSNLPPSTVFAHTFDQAGKLTGTDIILRYSGRQLYSITYDTHSEGGLPVSGQLTTNFTQMPLSSGSRPPVNDTRITFDFGYDADFHITEMNRYYNLSTSNDPITFGAYDETHRPLEWSTSFESSNGLLNEQSSYTVSYENGLLASEVQEFVYEDQDRSIQGTFTVENDFNAAGNFDAIESLLERVTVTDFGDGAQTAIETRRTVTNFTYTSNRTMLSRITERAIDRDGEINNVRFEYSYDDQEFTTLLVYTDDFGNREENTYEDGVQVSFEYSFDNQLSDQTFYAADGSYTRTLYFYNGDGEVFQTLTEEFDRFGAILSRTGYEANGLVIYVQNFENGNLISMESYSGGNLSSVTEYSYLDTGQLGSTITRDVEERVLGTEEYSYNSDGALDELRFFDAEGNSDGYWSYQYDANGLIAQLTSVNANGNLLFIEYYEGGTLTRFEQYDGNGNLIDVFDYTDSAKQRVSGKPHKAGTGPILGSMHLHGLRGGFSGAGLLEPSENSGLLGNRAATIVEQNQKLIMNKQLGSSAGGDRRSFVH